MGNVVGGAPAPETPKISSGSSLPPKPAVNKKTGAKKGPKGSKADTKLIVEKRLEGPSTLEMHSILEELKGMKHLIETNHQQSKGGQGDEEEEEDDSKLPLLHKLHKKFKSTVDGDAPVNDKLKKRLPFSVTAVFWLMGKIAFGFLLAYFTYSSYSSDQQTKNLSLDSACANDGCKPQDANSPYRLCLSVPNSITNKYVLDVNGYWNGMTAFLAGRGMYAFTFNAFAKSQDEYNAFMLASKAVIASIASGSVQRQIHENLLYGMAWTYLYVDGANTHKIQLQADAAYVFNRFYKSAALGTNSVQCYADPDIKYDKGSGDVSIIYTYGTAPQCKCTAPGCVSTTTGQGPTATTSYSGTLTCDSPSGGSGYLGAGDNNEYKVGCCPQPTASSCTDTTSYCSADATTCALVPNDFGYQEAFDPSHFTLKYNVRSLVAAMAINLGVTQYAAYDKVYTAVGHSIMGCYVGLYGDDCKPWALNGSSTCPKSSWGLAFNATSERCSVTVSGTKYVIDTRMDAHSPGMDPVYCLINETQWDNGNNPTPQPYVCLLRSGKTFIYPYFSHMGTSHDEDFYSWGKGCWCSKPDFPSSYASFYTSDYYPTSSSGLYNGQDTGTGTGASYCNKFDFVHGGIMFKGKNYDAVLGYMVKMAGLYTAKQLNNMAYIAGFATVRLGGAAGQTSQSSSNAVGTQTTRDALSSKLRNATTWNICSGPNQCTTYSATNAFSFMTFDTGVTDSKGSSTTMPTILAVNTYDEIDQRVNDVGVVVSTSSCLDFMGIQAESWDDGSGAGAANVAPTKLVQDYYECYNSITTSVLISFGSASGTAASISPLFMLIVVSLFSSFFLPKTGKRAAVAEAGKDEVAAADAPAEARNPAASPAVPPAVPVPKRSWFFGRKQAAGADTAISSADGRGLELIRAETDLESGEESGEESEYEEVEVEVDEEEEEGKG